MAVNPNWTTSFGSPVAMDAVAITPANSDLAVPVRALYVGGAGDVVIRTMAGTDVTLVGVVAGSVLPIAAKQVRVATTATSIVGLL
jgi:hypothetical protein